MTSLGMCCSKSWFLLLGKHYIWCQCQVEFGHKVQHAYIFDYLCCLLCQASCFIQWSHRCHFHIITQLVIMSPLGKPVHYAIVKVVSCYKGNIWSQQHVPWTLVTWSSDIKFHRQPMVSGEWVAIAAWLKIQCSTPWQPFDGSHMTLQFPND